MTENGNKTEARTFTNQAELHSSDTVKQSNSTWGWRRGEADRKCLQDEIPSQTDIDQNVLLFFWIIGHADWF